MMVTVAMPGKHSLPLHSVDKQQSTWIFQRFLANGTTAMYACVHRTVHIRAKACIFASIGQLAVALGRVGKQLCALIQFH